MTLLDALIIVLLILATSFYVAAEFSAVSVRRSRIRQLVEEGHTLAARLLPILENPAQLDRYIAACQIGITLSSLVLGAFGQATLAEAITPLFEHWGGMQTLAAQSGAAILVLIGLTVLHVILGELIPKSVALQYPTQTALYTYFPMRWSLLLFSWFIPLLNGSGIALLKLFRVPQADHRHIHSPEEIDLLIAESHVGGLLEPDEQQRLHQALKLGARQVRQLMVPRMRIAGIDIDTPMFEAVRILAKSPYTRMPVYRDSTDHILGMLHTKDLVTGYVEQRPALSIRELMRPILRVSEDIMVDRLLGLLRENGCHQAIVLDELGEVTGLITLEDVLAEVFGELADEFKSELPQPELLSDGRVRLPGFMRLDQAKPWLGVLWQGEADTIGGHIINTLGRLPGNGERLSIDGVEIEIEHMARRVIGTILAKPTQPSAGEETLG